MKHAHVVASVLFGCLLLSIGAGAPVFGAPDQSPLSEAAEAARRTRSAETETDTRTFSNEDLVTTPSEFEADLDLPLAPSANTGTPDALARHEVPYQAYGGTARRVIVTVRFNGSVAAPIALDTGAPGTIISSDLAARLGILGAGQGGVVVLTSGIGGTIPAVRTIIDTIEVGEARQQFALVTVVPSLSSDFEGLLGMDFLSTYTVGIDPQAEILVLEELPTDPSWRGGRDQRWWRTSFAELNTMRRQWADFRDELAAQSSEGSRSEDQRRLRSFAETQFNGADELLRQLSRRARLFAVPMHWRESGSR